MNLPREQRFQQGNVILAGIIPSPNEPGTLNPFFDPLVEKLSVLWKGINMNLPHCEGTIRAAILCTGCDILSVQGAWWRPR